MMPSLTETDYPFYYIVYFCFLLKTRQAKGKRIVIRTIFIRIKRKYGH